MIANSELLSRSQLLLQYLLAIDTTMDDKQAFEHPAGGLEARATAGDPDAWPG